MAPPGKDVVMLPALSFLPVLGASLAGALLGCLTGMVPGFHSNNVAATVGADPGLLLMVATLGTLAVDDPAWALVASCAVVSCAIAHTVANIVPSVYMAVPEGDTALTVLPGHRMVQAGRGGEALRISVVSSVASLAVATALVVPVRHLMASPVDLYRSVEPWLGTVLVAVSVQMMLKEASKARTAGVLRGWRAGAAAAGIFLTSGALGHLAIFQLGQVGPAFIGLFGTPMVLLVLLEGREAAPRTAAVATTDPERAMPWSATLRGTIAGTVVGWFPGISSAQATVLALPGGEGGEESMDGAREFIASVSAVNTANAVFTVVALATLLRVRSGAVAAVDGLMAWEAAPWASGALPTTEVTMLLVAAVVGGVVAAPVTLFIGSRFERAITRLSDRRVLVAILAMLVLMVAWGAGPVALLVLAGATGLGMLPPLMGLMRVHLMGVVMLPLAAGLLLL